MRPHVPTSPTSNKTPHPIRSGFICFFFPLGLPGLGAVSYCDETVTGGGVGLIGGEEAVSEGGPDGEGGIAGGLIVAGPAGESAEVETGRAKNKITIARRKRVSLFKRWVP